jgi:hypothetical protein
VQWQQQQQPRGSPARARASEQRPVRHEGPRADELQGSDRWHQDLVGSELACTTSESCSSDSHIPSGTRRSSCAATRRCRPRTWPKSGTTSSGRARMEACTSALRRPTGRSLGTAPSPASRWPPILRCLLRRTRWRTGRQWRTWWRTGRLSGSGSDLRSPPSCPSLGITRPPPHVRRCRRTWPPRPSRSSTSSAR